ncbi:hypothetical protein K2224_34790 (plasmid) [Streptomyces sp. BHT-5-2]|nr:hypothetical protein K2224_34790 [Streptomyces sp. BHT-5-2]
MEGATASAGEAAEGAEPGPAQPDDATAEAAAGDDPGPEPAAAPAADAAAGIPRQQGAERAVDSDAGDGARK